MRVGACVRACVRACARAQTESERQCVCVCVCVLCLCARERERERERAQKKHVWLCKHTCPVITWQFAHVEPNGVVHNRRIRDAVAPFTTRVGCDVRHAVMANMSVSVILSIHDTTHSTPALVVRWLALDHATVIRDSILDLQVRKCLRGREGHLVGTRVFDQPTTLVNVGVGCEGHDLLHGVGLFEGVFADAIFSGSALHDSEDVRFRSVPEQRLAVRGLGGCWLRV